MAELLLGGHGMAAQQLILAMHMRITRSRRRRLLLVLLKWRKDVRT